MHRGKGGEGGGEGRGLANIPVDGFTIAIICQKILRRGGGKRVSSRGTRGYSRFSPRKFGSVYTSIGLCALETRARVCSTRDTVTTYKGLVQAKRITYAF